MKNEKIADKAGNALVMRAVIALAVTLVAMKIHAEVTIGFSGTPYGVNQQSDGSPLDSSFTFELGTFDNGFVPSAGNTDQWLANWVPVKDASGTTLSGSTTQYGTQPGLFPFPDYDGYTSEVTLTHNNAPFEAGDQGYVWGYNSQTGDAEWILMTNTDSGSAWQFPSTSGVNGSEFWTVGTTGETIVGAVSFTDDNGDPISLQTASVGGPPIVPEPSTGLLLLATSALTLCRRRRRPGGR